MTITLGGVTLPDDLLWTERHQYAPVAMESRRTIGGRLRYSTAPLSGGRPITLVSQTGRGWLTLAQVQALAALAADPDTVLTLTVGAESYSVKWRWDEPPALDVTPGWGMAIEAESQDIWYGSIKLFEVAT